MERFTILMFTMLMSSSAISDEVTVPNQFVSGTTIQASQMNANFTALAAESNENDVRVSAAESDIAALSVLVNGRSLTWLGYTETPFVVDGSIDASPISLNNFCKAQFSNEAAEVANLDTLMAISRVQTVSAPIDSVAVLLPVFDELTAVHTGNTGTSSSRGVSRYWNIEVRPGRVCTLSPTFSVDCGLSTSGISNPLICVRAAP